MWDGVGSLRIVFLYQVRLANAKVKVRGILFLLQSFSTLIDELLLAEVWSGIRRDVGPTCCHPCAMHNP